MSLWHWLILLAVAGLLLYAVGVFVLVVPGRRGDARALAGFIPDCVMLFKRLLGDPRVARWRKGLLVAMIAYLAMPIDVVPDFILLAGQLDDAILVALVLRSPAELRPRPAARALARAVPARHPAPGLRNRLGLSGVPSRRQRITAARHRFPRLEKMGSPCGSGRRTARASPRPQRSALIRTMVSPRGDRSAQVRREPPTLAEAAAAAGGLGGGAYGW